MRKLTENGLAEFKNYLEKLRLDGSLDVPRWLLEHKDTSDVIEDDIQVEDLSFTSRFEMGEYLDKKFQRVNFQSYMGDTGLWSWLALFWFEQLCPQGKGGLRKPSMYYNYILINDFGHRPRHAIYMTWQLVHRYGDQAKFLLGKSMSARGELMEQFMGRQYILTTDGVMKLAGKLYTDAESGSFKKGAASKQRGAARRFTKFLNQIYLTYDLDTISAESLEELLPSEFDRFR